MRARASKLGQCLCNQTSVSGVGVTRDSMAAFAAMKKGSSDIKYTLFRIDQAHSGVSSIEPYQPSPNHIGGA